MKYTRKIIHSVQCTVGSNFFLFQCKAANSFYSKINDSSRVRTTAFSSSRFGVRVFVVPIFLRFTLTIFWCPKLVKHWRIPLRCFSALWDKKFRRKILILSPTSCPNFFDTRNQCNSKGFPYANFWHCETKNFRRKILILPPPLLSINFLATGSFLKHSAEGFNYEIFQHCETKSFRRKILILPPPPLSINFFATGNFLKHSTEGFPYEIFRHCETKGFRGKILMPPPLIHKLFRYRKFSERQQRRVHMGNFLAMWDKKISTENLDNPLPPPSYPQTFSLPEIFWNTAPKGSSTKYFGTVRQKIFDGNRYISLWSMKFFDTRNFLKHQRFPLRSFLVPWDKKNLTENRDTRPLSYP